MLSGGSADGTGAAAGPATYAWLRALPSPPATLPAFASRGNGSVTFALPAGYGAGVSLLVVVDGVPSNRLLFSYDAPVITK
jgi:hypothetical protein